MDKQASKIKRHVASLHVGERQNVRYDDWQAPMVREITFAGRETRKDGEWIVWRWKPEAATPEGRMDCGYSGYLIAPAQQAAA